jgi:hypothetical protein
VEFVVGKGYQILGLSTMRGEARRDRRIGTRE